MMEDVSTTLRPQPEDTLNIDPDLNDDNHAMSKEDTIKKILKMHQSAEDEKTKRTVLHSVLSQYLSTAMSVRLIIFT